MPRRAFAHVTVVLACVAASAAWAWAEEAGATASFPDDASREAFLLEGRIIRDRSAGEGVTDSRRVTLEREGVEHDAQVQIHDEYHSELRLESTVEIDFRDTWRNNVAAYRLDRLLGIGMVPTAVVRDYVHDRGAWSWWVDDVIMDEKERYLSHKPAPDPVVWNRQIFIVRLFDQLIYNFDRNLENLLIDSQWRLWMIDHTRAFKIFKDLREEKDLAPTCERHLLAALRTLDQPTLEKVMDGLLNDTQIDGLLARRDKIVRHYDGLIASRGEAAVLYDLPPRLPPPPPRRD
jgi:hypothetical protein